MYRHTEAILTSATYCARDQMVKKQDMKPSIDATNDDAQCALQLSLMLLWHQIRISDSGRKQEKSYKRRRQYGANTKESAQHHNRHCDSQKLAMLYNTRGALRMAD